MVQTQRIHDERQKLKWEYEKTIKNNAGTISIEIKVKTYAVKHDLLIRFYK